MKIDTSIIDGYVDMTPEQKLAAIEALEVPDPVDLSGYVKKDAMDKAAKEAAEYKRQLKEKMTAEESTAAEQQAKWDELQSNYNALLKKSTVAEHTAKFLALGYEEKLARETAEALFDGDMDKVFSNQQAFKAAMEKAIKADVLKQTPGPSGAGGGSEEKAENVELAKAMGAAKAASLKTAGEGLKNYL